jgi:glycosyltransferase involved in cell wall biosynthesis
VGTSVALPHCAGGEAEPRQPPGRPLSVWGIHDAQTERNPIPTACGYHRIVLPFDQLKAHGWKARYQAFTPPGAIADYKLVVAERLDRPQVLGSWRRLAARHRLAYEIDDDIWHVDPANAGAHRTYGTLSIQDAAEQAITCTELVTVTTEPLAHVIREKTGHPNVVVIPNYLPEAVLKLERKRNQHVTIGWTGGVSHTWDVSMVARPVRHVMDKDRSLRLHIIGSDFRPTFGLAVMARHTDWVPNPADYHALLDFDIGLAPLFPTAFAESKSYLKALDYAAMGIPVIASDFGPYREFVIDGVTGFLVGKEKQWRDRIRELVADADLRESMGAKARELAAQHTIEGNWGKWAAAYERVLR